MARLIDADALQLEPDPWGGMNGVLFLGRNGGKTMAMVQSALKRMIDDAPTIDAVPVVRCKDCKWAEYGKDYEPYCNHWKSGLYANIKDDDFCSYGERKDNGSWLGNKGKF